MSLSASPWLVKYCAALPHSRKANSENLGGKEIGKRASSGSINKKPDPQRESGSFSCRLHIPTPRGISMEQGFGQVFWLVDRPTRHAFPSLHAGQWLLGWLSSPHTAAGPRRLRTVFPTPKPAYTVSNISYTLKQKSCQIFLTKDCQGALKGILLWAEAR